MAHGLTGMVWIDGAEPTKEGLSEGTYDSLYASGDRTLSGIQVTLRNSSGERMATAVTGGDGRYNITKWDADVSKSLHTDPERDELYFWDLENAYVEFEYDNKKYICVDPFVGGATNVDINSKAQENIMEANELDDAQLSGSTAITKQNGEAGMSHVQMMTTKYTEGDLSSHGLTAYYNDDSYVVEFINLGLWEKLEPTYNIFENIQYSKVHIKGYTYTYDYQNGEKGLIADENTPLPGTNLQTGAKTYGATVYPSDIAYTAAGNEKGIEMYVVYKININNSTTTHYSDIYDEYALFLDSLENVYDSTRFEISNEHVGDVNYRGSEYFGHWSASGETATYDLNDKEIDSNSITAEGHKLSEGIASGETKSVYIQFKVKQNFLESMLREDLTNIQMERIATKTISNGYHIYYRNDYLWNGGTERYTSNSKFEDIKETIDNLSGKYVHRSVNQVEESGALALVLKLAETRTITGSVYEDEKLNKNEGVHEALGDGIKADGEDIAEGVKVELINAEEYEKILYDKTEDKDKINPTTIYDGNFMEEGTYGGRPCVVKTDSEGNYTIKGVVPGLYYLRFTYPDGTTKMVNANEDIKTNNYKSTIINTQDAGTTIQDAMETRFDDMKQYLTLSKTAQARGLADAAQKFTEWYKYLNRNTYNIATDDMERRDSLGNKEYLENFDETTTVKESGTEEGRGIENYDFGSVWSYTPYFSITIENTETPTATVELDESNPGYSHKYVYTGFNLGLIKTPITDIKIDKIITNIKLQSSSGEVLSNRNPKESTNYVTALDRLPVEGGSKYSRVEMMSEEMFGSAITASYQITITNNSEEDYIEEDGNTSYGYYFKYGDKENAKLKQTTITEVIDLLDLDYDIKSQILSEFVNHPQNAKDGEGIVENRDKVTVGEGNDSWRPEKYISIKDFSPFEAGATITVTYEADCKLEENMDMLLENAANIVSFKADTGSVLRTGYVWNRITNTNIVISPDTGGDKRQINYKVITIALIILAAGIVVIKCTMRKKE